MVDGPMVTGIHTGITQLGIHTDTGIMSIMSIINMRTELEKEKSSITHTQLRKTGTNGNGSINLNLLPINEKITKN